MAEIINLNHVRKAKAKSEAKTKAQSNRLTFGRTKQERTLTDKEKASVIRHIDGHKLRDD